MKHYIITRFSILDYNYGGYKLTRNNSFEKYKDELFDTKRLDFKFYAFEKVTYKSVTNQSYKNYIWLIYTSTYLPENYKKRLERIVRNNNKIKIIYVKDFKEFNNSVNYKLSNEKNYSTVRLDDDDGIHKDFLLNLNKYENKKNVIISYPKGVLFTIIRGKIINLVPVNNPNNAQGLTALGMNIYLCGDHSKVSEKYNVIYDDLDKAYYICKSKYSDSKMLYFRYLKYILCLLILIIIHYINKKR